MENMEVESESSDTENEVINVIIIDSSEGEVEILIDDHISIYEEEVTTEVDADQQTLPEVESFSCQECPRTFPDRDRLWDHILVHAQLLEAPYICDHCNSVFRFADEIILHIQTKHRTPYFQCKICLRNFKYEQCFLNHERAHRQFLTATSPFRVYSNLKTYSRILTLPKPSAPRPSGVVVEVPSDRPSEPGPSRKKFFKKKEVKPVASLLEPKKTFPSNLKTYSRKNSKKSLFESNY